MYAGYLVLGGTQVYNQDLTYHLVENGDCPAGWLRCKPCPGLSQALGEVPADMTVQNAPWYDAEDPATHRFYGFYPLEVDGAEGSTRTATITEGIFDGGVVKGTRKAVREVRVRGVMIGNGHDALDAGLAWLDSVLDGDRCSTHPGGGCGEVDACFFITCPPERPIAATFTPWAIQSTNFNLNPRILTSTAGWVASNGGVLNPSSEGGRLAFAAGAGTGLAVLTQTAFASAAEAETWIGSFELTVAAGYPTVTVRVGEVANDAGGSQVGAIQYGDPVTIAAGETVRVYSAPLTTPALTAGTRTTLYTAAAFPAGAQLRVRNALHEQSASQNPYFDGTTPALEDQRGTWSGAPDNSVSWLESRFETQAPVDDATYDAIIDPLRRRMHGVTAISGPLVLQHLTSRPHWHAYEVEFTLAAATPYVFNMPKRLALTPTTPSVMQDSPFNLVPYPSAELAGAPVVVATNYATNPSVETNVTGWTVAAGAPILAANLAGVQSNELASVGTYSYKTTFTAPGAGAAGQFGAEQIVTLPALTNARYSVNLWASASVQSGTAVVEGIEYHVIWQTPAGAVLRTDLLGTAGPGGGAMSMKSIQPPATAGRAVVRARARLTSWSAGAIVRLYVDALAVTVP